MNVALTIFSCIIIGMMVYKNGTNIIYASLLFISSLICFFALADSYEMLMET